MRPVKDRWTWPARTPPVSARPPRRDVARAGVAHANTGPAARGCWPRTDGLRGSIRRRDRSSRGSANGDAVPNHLPHEGQLGPQITRPSAIGLTHHRRVLQLRRVRWPETAGRTEHVRHRSPHSQASARLVHGDGAREGGSGPWPAITQGPTLRRSPPRLRSIDEGPPQRRATGREAPPPTHLG